MFGFYHTKKAFKADCANFATPYDTQVKAEKKAPLPARKHRNPLRIAVCAVAALALVLTGSVITPAVLNPQKSADSFEIVAYATDGKGKATLKQDVNVALPHGFIQYRHYKNANDSYAEWMTGFLCSGKNLSNVTYSCKSGTFSYSSREEYLRENQARKKSIVCTIKLPASKITLDHEKESFVKLLKDGVLNTYCEKYFKSKTIDLNRYKVTMSIIRKIKKYGDGPHWVVFGGYSYNKDKFNRSFFDVGSYYLSFGNPPYDWKKDANKAVIVIQDVKYPDYGFSGALIGQSLTAPASDHEQNLIYDNRNSYKIMQIFRTQMKKNGKIDYSVIPGDTVSIKAKFKDGKIISKYVKLSYDKAGHVCGKLTN